MTGRHFRIRCVVYSALKILCIGFHNIKTGSVHGSHSHTGFVKKRDSNDIQVLKRGTTFSLVYYPFPCSRMVHLVGIYKTRELVLV